MDKELSSVMYNDLVMQGNARQVTYKTLCYWVGAMFRENTRMTEQQNIEEYLLGYTRHHKVENYDQKISTNSQKGLVQLKEHGAIILSSEPEQMLRFKKQNNLDDKQAKNVLDILANCKTPYSKPFSFKNLFRKKNEQSLLEIGRDALYSNAQAAMTRAFISYNF